MSNYVKSTNFASKDALATGNPLKIVKGTEIDTEFNNIATAVATKADIASPALTGIPTAPTASLGTETTQLATTAFVQAAIEALHPVGSIYINASNGTNPGSLLGFGTWVAFGAGRVPVGFDSTDPSFDVAEETGGSKDAIVVAHTHTGTTSTNGDHNHSYSYTPQAYGAECCGGNYWALPAQGATTGNAGSHNHTFTTDSSGSSGTNANLQPYITVYMWKRTA